ncbi:MAG: hypothetical protein HQK77_18075 [Desulfobacterales bacterium]|nr:hypothetical protein [Desulfobacterales bacterium]
MKRYAMQWVVVCCVIWMNIAIVFAVEKKKQQDTSKDYSPIRITADELISTKESRCVQFIGHVKAVQDDTEITGDRMRIFYKESGNSAKENNASQQIDKIEVDGHVEIKFDNRLAITSKAVYTIKNQQLILTGKNTTVKSGQSFFIGETIILYREQGRIEVKRGQEKPVEVFLHPGDKGL